MTDGHGRTRWEADRRTWLAALAAVAVAVAALAAPVSAAPASPAGAPPPRDTRVVDADTVFHRLYVIGCGRSRVENEAFAGDAAAVKGALEGTTGGSSAPPSQDPASTTNTVTRPSLGDLIRAINELKNKALAGQEVTIFFVGHGGGGGPYGSPDGDEEPFDEHFWLNCGGPEVAPNDEAGDTVTDDALRRMLAGFRPGVTLVLIMDSCWGGGFTGGSSDLPEDGSTAVIGPSGECPVDTQAFIGGTFENRLFEDFETTLADSLALGAVPVDVPVRRGSAADFDGDGVVTAAELKRWLDEAGFDLGPPVDTTVQQPPKAGKSKCTTRRPEPCIQPGLSLPFPTVLPGGRAEVTGRGFPADTLVDLILLTPPATETTVQQVLTSSTGGFRTAVTMPLGTGPYVLSATTLTHHRDHLLTAVLPAGGTYADDNGSIHEGFTEAIGFVGITRGCAAALYCPTRSVNRGQMAAFLVRALGLPIVGGNSFADDDGSTFEPEIQTLAAAGITTGCAPGRFCPDAAVTRGQLATFLGRALLLTGTPADRFGDDNGSVHEVAINRLAAAGITTGCGPAAFCPSFPVSRAQMATLLGRGFLLFPLPPPPGIDFDGDGDLEQVNSDPDQDAGQAQAEDLDRDGKVDRLTVGTRGGGRVAGSSDVDGDGDDEVIVEDPTAAPGPPTSTPEDGDTDIDVVWVPTRGGGRVVGTGDTHREHPDDTDPDADEEIIVEDPTLGTGQTQTAHADLNPDGDRNVDDADADIVWVGTREGGRISDVSDRDGDGDDEIVFDDPTLPLGTDLRVDLDGDGDPDLIRVGTGRGIPGG